jgi:hypothetical protein
MKDNSFCQLSLQFKAAFYRFIHLSENIADTMKTLSGFLIIAILGVCLSCKMVEYQPTGAGDAILITLVTENDTLYGVGLHAYTYDEFTKVTAYNNSQSNKIFNLTPFNGYKNDLSYETPRNEMAQTIPPTGTYTFVATFPSDEIIDMTDELSSQTVLPPVITLCQYNNETDNVVVSWGEVLDSEVLNIKLYSMDRKLLFISNSMNPDVVMYSFGTKTAGWQTSDLPKEGEHFIVEISTYVFEPITGGSLNIQATGRIEKEIVWGN